MAEMASSTHKAAGLLLVAAMSISSGAAAAGAADNTLPGRYLLVGAMETGSIIELQPGGRFKYAISVGSMDAQHKGKWSFDPKRRLLQLKADGADALIAKALSVKSIQPLSEATSSLPKDHRARTVPNGLVVLVASPDPGAVSSVFAHGYYEGGKPPEVTDDFMDSRGRWFVMPARPPSLVVFDFGTSFHSELVLEIKDAPPAGSMLVVHYEPELLMDAQGVPLMQTFTVAADGSLKPWAEGMYQGGSTSQSRYVRQPAKP